MELDALSWTQCASAEIHSSSQTLEMDCPMSCGVCVRLKTMPTDLRANIRKLNDWLCLGKFGFVGYTR